MEFDNLHSRPGKVMEFWPRSWKVMEFDVGKCVCSRTAYCSGLSELYAGKHIKLRQEDQNRSKEKCTTKRHKLLKET